MVEVVAAGSSTSPLPYPPTPEVPPSLTATTPAYRRGLWVAVAALLGFLALYFGLIGYLGFVIARVWSRTLESDGSYGAAFMLSIVPALFLALLLSGLRHLRVSSGGEEVELSRADEPMVFAFVERLAAEAGASRPHRIFVSPEVNASVSPEPSLRNLLWATQKNLTLGIGLVDVLTLDELKAVIAHELGHFTQRSGPLGPWVYRAQRLALVLVHARGRIDGFFAGIAAIDLRVAWIGWGLQALAWALRSVLGAAHTLVTLAERAMRRQDEFRADRVAVSLTGSESLVRALYRLRAADDAWSEALELAVEAHDAGEPIEDLAALARRVRAETTRILDDPSYAEPPARVGPDQPPLFPRELAQSPRMWRSHPLSAEREANAKAVYVPSPLDPRPAWTLFKDPEALCRKVTARLVAEWPTPSHASRPTPEQEPTTLATRLARRYECRALEPRRRGVYLARATVRSHATADAALGRAPELSSLEALQSGLDGLYGDDLRADVLAFRELRREEDLLLAVRDGELEAPGGVVRLRGVDVAARELPQVIEEHRAARRAVEARLVAHDVRCRALHRAAAARLAPGWSEALEALVRTHHFAAHSGGHLSHLRRTLLGLIAVTGSGRPPSRRERKRITQAAHALEAALVELWASWPAVRLGTELDAALADQASVAALATPLQLPAFSDEELGGFVQAVLGACNTALEALTALCAEVLEQLLAAEDAVAEALRGQRALGAAPSAPVVPQTYPRRTTLDDELEEDQPPVPTLWTRFLEAEAPRWLVPRTLVAATLLFATLSLGGSLGHVNLYVVNGLGHPVVVRVGPTELRVPPCGHAKTLLDADERPALEAFTDGGERRAIEVEALPKTGVYDDVVYNVAGATAFERETVRYGPGRVPPPPVSRGAARVFLAPEDYILRDPPQTAKEGTTYTALSSLCAAGPDGVLADLDPEARRKVILAHLRWDPTTHASFDDWVGALQALGEAEAAAGRALLLARRPSGPTLDVSLERALQALAAPAEAAADCVARAADRELSATPETADRIYLAWRCVSDDQLGAAEAFVTAWSDVPEHPWLAFAASRHLMMQERYHEALSALEVTIDARQTQPIARAALDRLLRGRRLAAAMGVLGPDDALRLGRYPDQRWREAPEKALGDRDEPRFVTLLRSLHQGQLEQAALAARSEGPREAAILAALAAASDGATPELVQASLGVELMGHAPSLAARAGLELRLGREPIALAALEPILTSTVVAILSKPAPGDLAALDAATQTLDVTGRALARVVVLVARGAGDADRAPPDAWRTYVRAALLPSERPALAATAAEARARAAPPPPP